MESFLNIPPEMIIPNSQIVQGKLLGKGGFGYVYEAKWNRDTVAIKRLILEKMNPQTQAEFEKESSLHMKLSHPRVVQLYGVIAEPGQPYRLVVEYAANGSLFKFLEKAASQGHAGAQYDLGYCYYNGQGVTQDYVEAVKYYRLAAEQRNADAQYMLGQAITKEKD
ncbi:MAG: Sel1-like repeat-containing protein kinase family protein [Parachlamydiaceae bacterium]